MNPPLPGKRAYLWSPPGSPDLPPLPVREACGGRPGPHLLVTAGVHGDEYEGPAALERGFAALDRAPLAGRLTLLPVVNVGAWQARQRRTPDDDADLNRAFPGDPNGGPTARLAHSVWTAFIEPADVVVDLHSGGLAFVHLPLVGTYAGAGEIATQVSRAFDGRFRRWVIPDAHGVLSHEAHRAGKPAIGVEWGGGGTLDPAGVAALHDALGRCLLRLGMTREPVAPWQPDSRPPIAGNYVNAPATGLFQTDRKLGETVGAGDRLGDLINPLTGQVTSVRAERKGEIGGLAHRAWVETGERIAYLG